MLTNFDQQCEQLYSILGNVAVHRRAVDGGQTEDSYVHVNKFISPYRPFLNLIKNAFSVFKLKLCLTLQEPDIVKSVDDVPNYVSIAEHRIRVLHQLATSIIEDQETISGEKVQNMCSNIMRYMHRCFAMADIIM